MVSFSHLVLASVVFFSSINAEYVQRYEGVIKAEFAEYPSVIQALLLENPVIIEDGERYGEDTVNDLQHKAGGVLARLHKDIVSASCSNSQAQSYLKGLLPYEI